MDYLTICSLDKKLCCGCLLCAHSCPKGAISMQKDDLGFCYPLIDETKCVRCGLCYKICPEINTPKLSVPTDVYAAKLRDKKKLHKCSSGGLATAFSEWCLNNNWIVYGAKATNKGAVYNRANSLEDIHAFKGSKYIQSDMSMVYENILNDLNNSRVLFIGSPCEVDAIQRFCHNDKNLTCISFPCGGWSSFKILDEEIRQCFPGIEYDSFSMRERHHVSIKIYKEGIEKGNIPTHLSLFMASLDSKASVRTSCWECKYCRAERIGDIVVGDFWGLRQSDIFKESDIKDGVSFCGILTEKGNALFESIKKELMIEKSDYCLVKKSNPRLNYQIKSDKSFDYSKHKRFYRFYHRYGLKVAVSRTLRLYYIKRKCRFYIKKIIGKNNG